MSKRIEVKAGQVFGSWTVIKEAEATFAKNGKMIRMISCKCKCGEINEVQLASLRTGKSTRCRKCSSIEMSKKNRSEIKKGERFGDWTVIKEVEPMIAKCGRKIRMVLCLCDCGKKGDVQLCNLRNGVSKQCKECKKIKVNPGFRYGDWTIIKEVEKKNNTRYFSCRCKCGTVQDIRLSNLRSGNSNYCKRCRGEIIESDRRYNNWIVKSESDRRKGRRYMTCECKCGTIEDVDLGSLRSGASKQCIQCAAIEVNKKLQERLRDYRKSKGLDPDTLMSGKDKLEREVFFSCVRTSIFVRDNSKCQICFKHADAVHHIIPWSACRNPEDQQLRYDPENCISLCKECHMKAHDGNSKRIDHEIAEQLLAKAIENTEKDFEYMKGLKEKALKKVSEIV